MAAKVKPIPDGYHTVTPHLTVRGAGKAIEFYKRAFGAEEIFRMPGPNDTVMHAELQFGDSRVFINDEYPDMGAQSPQALSGTPVTIHLYAEDCDALYNKAVQAGAEATMPLMDMFWGDRYGKVRDPFGHHWSIATHTEDVDHAEMQKRQAEWEKNMQSGQGCA